MEAGPVFQAPPWPVRSLAGADRQLQRAIVPSHVGAGPRVPLKRGGKLRRLQRLVAARPPACRLPCHGTVQRRIMSSLRPVVTGPLAAPTPPPPAASALPPRPVDWVRLCILDFLHPATRGVSDETAALPPPAPAPASLALPSPLPGAAPACPPLRNPMSSLVADFIINPVLRQARRLSEISRSVSAGDGGHAGATAPLHAVSDCGDHGEAPAEEPSPDEDHAGEPAPDESPALPETPRSTHADVSADEAGADGVALPDQPPHDHLGFPLASRRGRALPEDDGMQGLRVRIHAVNARDIASAEKARLMHEILLEGYRASRAGSRAGLAPSIPESNEAASEVHEQPAAAGPLDSLMFWNGQSGDAATERFNLSETDVAPTYAPIRQSKTPGTQTPVQTPTTPQGVAPPLGCQHYERNVKLQCSTCSKWYTCRFCHDAREDHSLVRKDTKNMLCMLCGTPQRASDVCIRCGETAAQYYCNICKLWENRQTKPIYHCNDCGICRRGLGLGKDFFHCKVRTARPVSCAPTER